ncbi:MAG: DAK2 domain-containing protein [Firmicutes bacterium]|nr:DAK2 domain-containing protein [Bacillota bacterium]
MSNINGLKFRQMLVAGANRLEAQKKLVDEMNVFPVPDGDTGTNMSLTVTSAVKEVMAVSSDSVSDIAKALSSGALRGARGNSGVIVSQLFRGLYKGLKGCETIDSLTLASAMQRGVATAYKAVMKPKEGTILTVAKAAAEKAAEVSLQSDDLVQVMEEALKSAEDILEKTPEMLPVLKEAGVVDAGGKGLTLIYRGFYEALLREDTEIDPIMALSQNQPMAEQQAAKTTVYCVELVVDSGSFENTESKAGKLEEAVKGLGTGVLSGFAGKDIKLHLHTEKPADVLSAAMDFGPLKQVKIENMEISHQHILGLKKPVKAEEPRKEIGFITISVGEGLKSIFTELGVDHVISGGQTMNPSTEDILQGAECVNADHIFVLPNNKNIILAAQQAALMSKEKKLHVLPSKSVPQGIAAMIGYMPGESVESNIEQMTESLEAVTSGAVTYAVRDTHMGEFEIKEGDILALKNGDMCRVGQDLMQTTRDLIDEMITDETGIFTIYFGSDSSREQAEELGAYINSKYDAVEVEIQEGDQPIYYFLLSAE